MRNALRNSGGQIPPVLPFGSVVSKPCFSPDLSVALEKKVEITDIDDAPIYRPSIEEFADPLRYIRHIRHEAEQFGICKIIPPDGWYTVFSVEHRPAAHSW